MKAAVLLPALLCALLLVLPAATAQAAASDASPAADCTTLVGTALCTVEDAAGSGCAPDPPVTGATYCFLVGAADPLVRTCDVVGLPNLVLCIVGQEVDNAQAYADALCRDTVCYATPTTHHCDGVLPATWCFLDAFLYGVCEPEPPVIGTLRCYSNAVPVIVTYAQRLCDAVTDACTG